MRKKKNTEQFISEAKQVHGDKYDYSDTVYHGSGEKLAIICKVHGKFHQIAYAHIIGRGCANCSYYKNGLSCRLSQEVVLDQFRAVHGDKFDYSRVDYQGDEKKIEIICSKHGIFKQTPGCHKSGRGCEKCHTKYIRNTTEQFIENARKKHGDIYDYSLSNYTHAKHPVIIICKDHGQFEQIADSHTYGQGCPRCHESLGERRINKFLTENRYNFTRQYSTPKCKDLALLRFDFAIFIENRILFIEFQGYQHYQVPWFSSRKEENQKIFNGIQKRDQIKRDFCKANNIPLLEIKYDNKNIDKTIEDFIQENTASLTCSV